MFKDRVYKGVTKTLLQSMASMAVPDCRPRAGYDHTIDNIKFIALRILLDVGTHDLQQ